ncbi:hypothetical protein ACSBR1_006676 [Camellia fascicularis]
MWSGGIIVALVMVEFLEVCLNTVSKAAMKRGMSNCVFVLYSHTIATIFLFLSTLIFHSCCLQLFMVNGIGDASPTLASAMTNLTPVWTFLLTIVFRMEKLNLKVKGSQAKSIGSIISIIGAFIVTLYKGPSIIFSSSSLSNSLHQLLLSPPPSWILGGFVLAVASFLKALLYIVQAWIIKDYPAELMIILISSIFGTIISAIVCLIAERDLNAWILRLDIELLAIGFSAIYGIGLRNVIHIWALKKKGPIFVTMFKPLGIVIAVIMGVSFLGDSLYLGSVIGAVIIVVGFYAVVWGKAKDEKTVEDSKIIGVESSSSTKVPLLENRMV